HVRRRRDPAAGQDERIAALVPLLAGYLSSGGRVVGNFGAANPDAACEDFAKNLHGAGLRGLRIGVIRGDDVRDLVQELDSELPELGTTVGALGGAMVSANAYIGAEPVVEALRRDAQIVLGGRLADPSLFVGPICHELGWDLDDWDRVAHATLVGHLLECGVHSTGGNFEDPPFRVVPDPHNLGFPLADVEDGSVVVTKLPGTGGAVDERTMKTQLYYEIHDPAAYLTPDVTADFSTVRIDDLGGDRVRLSGARGRERPGLLKVLVGVDQGWKATGEMSYGGPGCFERARRAEEIVRRRLERHADLIDDVRFDLQGVDSLFGDRLRGGYPTEVRLRMALRTRDADVARAAVHEIELLYFGPAGGGGATGGVVPALGVTPAYVPRDLVSLDVEVVTV
ncbi:MAG: acyclic terpene utilization AtuA family protein, partial [Kineosporiaceae bacterium]